jgi:CHAT domain-containing protein
VLGALYDALLAPVAHVVDKASELTIVPYGILHSVPFHGLYDRNREQYVVERLNISVCPSRRLLEMCRRRQRRKLDRALVIGHSANGALPFALDEAQHVSSLLPGVCFLEDNARSAAIRANAAQYGVLHIAAHGQARLDDPSFSYLLLADGSLQMADVVQLALGGALVTLSCCETGRATVTRGDEVLNLSRGFLYAGATTVVQSLWPVLDDITRDLMVSFYSQLKLGCAPAGALGAAQRAAIHQAAHPSMWAAFQVVGHGGR